MSISRKDHLAAVQGDMVAHCNHMLASILHDLGVRLLTASIEICNRGEPNLAAVRELCRVIANDLTDDWPFDFEELFEREADKEVTYYVKDIENVIEGVKATMRNQIFAALIGANDE